MNDLAGFLYDSLRSKIMLLPNDVIVYPAHGAGSACGKNMSKETTDTLGNQKLFNYALRANMTKEEFVKEVTDGLTKPPQYFPQNVRMNKEGYESMDVVMERAAQALSAAAFEAAANETGAVVLDTRPAQIFNKGFIPNAINIGLKGDFAPWVGALIPDVKQELLLVTEIGEEEETILRLARVGYDNVIGYLEGGIETWKTAGQELDTITSITAGALADKLQKENVLVIDVRRSSEFAAEHIDGAKSIPLDAISELMAAFPKDETMYIHCAGGYRSMIAASILKSRGYDNLIDIEGGFAAISQSGRFILTDFVCPTTKIKS